jgi:hypothetical protein
MLFRIPLILIISLLFAQISFGAEKRHLIIKEKDLLSAANKKSGAILSLSSSNASSTATFNQSGFVIHKTARSTLEFYFNDGKYPQNSGFLVSNIRTNGHDQEIRELPLQRIKELEPRKTLIKAGEQAASLGFVATTPGAALKLLQVQRSQRWELWNHPVFSFAVRSVSDIQMAYYKSTIETLLLSLDERPDIFFALPNSEVQNLVIYNNEVMTQGLIAAAIIAILAEHGVTSTQ